MRASTSLEEGAPILVGCHTIYRGRHQERGAPLHLVERQAIQEGASLVLEGATLEERHHFDESRLHLEGAPPWAHDFVGRSPSH